MPFDANLVLIDGTVTFTAATAASYAVATSTTRVTATGAAVVDLGTAGSGLRGLAAVLIIPTLATATDYLTMIIEGSDEEAFGNASYNLHLLAEFDIAAATRGRILASECTAGAVVIRRFTTEWRYVRARGTPTAGDSTGTFSTLQVLLSPYPWQVL